MMKLDILAFAAHPDDVELSASGTLIKHIAQGKKCGIIDITRGQLGSRGTSRTRAIEAADATEVMGLSVRENLGLEDGWFRAEKEQIISASRMIRKYRPEVILANAIHDRHPDHERGADFIREAIFFSGLRKIEIDGMEPWRPKHYLHYIQDRYIEPDVVVDISPYFEQKMKAIMSFKTQFFDPNYAGPSTPISGQDFIHYLEGRAREMGRIIGVEYGEGYTVPRAIGVEDLTQIF